MRGIQKNRPDPSTLPLNPKRTVFVDSGSFYGEDIIDCIMADRGEVILPLRNLNGFDELNIPLDLAENLMIGMFIKPIKARTAAALAPRSWESKACVSEICPRYKNNNIRIFNFIIII